jgi:hypothetical protein
VAFALSDKLHRNLDGQGFAGEQLLGARGGGPAGFGHDYALFLEAMGELDEWGTGCREPARLCAARADLDVLT